MKNEAYETNFFEKPKVSKAWIKGCVVQAWCQKPTAHIELDAVLAEVISEQVEKMFAECGFELMP